MRIQMGEKAPAIHNHIKQNSFMVITIQNLLQQIQYYQHG